MKKCFAPTLILVLAVFGGLLIPAEMSADPPSQSGPIVFRYQVNWGWAYIDDGLLAVHGFDLEHWCNLGCPGAEGCFETDELHELQEIVSPADEGLFIHLFNGDNLTTTVWPWEGSLCASFDAMEGVPLAFGTVDLISTDNDVLAYLFGHPRHNAFKVGAHGVLETPAGERLVFNGHENCVWHPDFDFRCNSKIIIR